jgi:hypothetical protein
MPTGAKCVKLGFVLLVLLSLKENIISLPKVGQGLGWVGVIRKVSEVEKREVFLRAFLVVLCLLEGRVYLELDGLEISGNLCRFLSH